MKVLAPTLLLFVVLACASAPKILPPSPLTPKPLTESSFAVAPGQYVTYKFTTSLSQTVAGHFQAQGGRGNDIKVLILDDDQFSNWKNHHAANAYFNSGQVTAGTINVGLNAGTYYLVFDNTFSVISNKAITADIQLQ